MTGKNTLKTYAFPRQIPSGPVNSVSSGMPKLDSWGEARLPCSGTWSMPGDFNTKVAKIYHSRLGDKEQIGTCPDVPRDYQSLLPS